MSLVSSFFGQSVVVHAVYLELNALPDVDVDCENIS